MNIGDINSEKWRALCRRKGVTGITMWILYQIMLKNRNEKI